MIPEEEKMAVVGGLWLHNNTYRDVAELCDTYGPLFAGTENERKGKDWILAKFKDYGLENARAEEFKYVGWRRGDICKLELIGHRSFCGRPMKVWSLPRSPPTPEEGVEGEVIYLGSGTREDFERNESKIPGKIVMVQSGGPPGKAIYRIAKFRLARKMGAAGFIFMFGMEGDIIPTGTVLWGPDEDGEIDKPPGVAIAWETGQYIVRLLEKGPVRARITTNDGYVPNTSGWNIIGDIPGDKYPDEIVLVGAHWDGHDIGQGALDDALGALGILNIGKALAKYKGKFKRTLRIVNFGNEEIHCIGSRYYVEKYLDDLKNTVCMFNCDGFARRGNMVIRTNNPELLRFMRNASKVEDVPISIAEDYLGRSGSDGTPFYLEGVPTSSVGGSVEAGATSSMRAKGRYPDHTVADTVDKMDVKKIRTASIKFAQILMAMLDAEKRFAHPVPKEKISRDVEHTMRTVESCRGRCIGYRTPYG